MSRIQRVILAVVVCVAFGATAEAACVNQPLPIPSTVNDEVTLSSCISISDDYNKYELTNLAKGRRLRFTVTKITLPQILIRLERAGSLVVQSSDYSKSTLTMDVELPADGGELGQSPTVFRANEFVKGPATMVSITGKASERSNLFIMTGNAETTAGRSATRTVCRCGPRRRSTRRTPRSRRASRT